MQTPQLSRATKTILIVEFVILSYMLYVLSTSLYKSYQVDRFISNAEEENQKLQSQNQDLTEDFKYYSSAAYQEKIAKQNLGLVRPGEEVIVLAPDGPGYLTESEKVSKASDEYYRSLPNPKKWFLFFFEREG